MIRTIRATLISSKKPVHDPERLGSYYGYRREGAIQRQNHIS